jgi:hypothetical protein
MTNQIRVQADLSEVEAALRAELSAEEMSHVSLSSSGAADPFQPTPRRDLPSVQTVVDFVSTTVAGGVLYDLIKKVSLILASRFPGKVDKNNDGKPS